MIRQLIENGAEVNVINTHKNTALLLAINKGKSNWNWINVKRYKRIDFLLHLGFDKIAEFLIEKGANVDAVGQDGNTPLIWSVYNGKQNPFW